MAKLERTPRMSQSPCSIARSLGVLGERWTFLILRDAFDGLTRFDEFRESLGIAADVLSGRLATLVEVGVLEKVDYQESGARRRHAYVLSPAGRELLPVLVALQEWGDKHLPWADGPTVARCQEGSDAPIHVGFVDEQGAEVPSERVRLVPTAVYPQGRLGLLHRRSTSA